jgi:hypothetical protein
VGGGGGFGAVTKAAAAAAEDDEIALYLASLKKSSKAKHVEEQAYDGTSPEPKATQRNTAKGGTVKRDTAAPTPTTINNDGGGGGGGGGVL